VIDQPAPNESPTGIPLYVEPVPRPVRDPACPETIDAWEGANTVTFRLLEALESLRDLRVALNDLASQSDPRSDRRRIKRISTPLYSFAWSVRNICKELVANPDSYGGLSDADKAGVQRYDNEMAGAVPLSGESPLRVVRNKIDAHVDPDTAKNPQGVWAHVNLANYVAWLACSLVTFKQLLALDVYAWTCQSTHPQVFRLMSVDGTLVDLVMVDGHPSMIAGVTQTTSPMLSIANELNAVITLHNSLLRWLPTGGTKVPATKSR
jgi:hypothetical protein